jgi:hypothetical protein
LPETAAGVFQGQKKNQHAQAPRRAGKTGTDDVKHERCEIKLAGAEDAHEPADHRPQNGSDDRRTRANPLHFVQAYAHGHHDLWNRNLDHAFGKTDG